MTLEIHINQATKMMNGLCRNDKTFKDMFTSFDSIITHISLDHDICCYDENGNEITGFNCLKWLCNYILDSE